MLTVGDKIRCCGPLGSLNGGEELEIYKVHNSQIFEAYVPNTISYFNLDVNVFNTGDFELVECAYAKTIKIGDAIFLNSVQYNVTSLPGSCTNGKKLWFGVQNSNSSGILSVEQIISGAIKHTPMVLLNVSATIPSQVHISMPATAIYNGPYTFEIWDLSGIRPDASLQCTCGSSKVHSNVHSSWCDIKE